MMKLAFTMEEMVQIIMMVGGDKYAGMSFTDIKESVKYGLEVLSRQPKTFIEMTSIMVDLIVEGVRESGDLEKVKYFEDNRSLYMLSVKSALSTDEEYHASGGDYKLYMDMINDKLLNAMYKFVEKKGIKRSADITEVTVDNYMMHFESGNNFVKRLVS